jgi:carbamoyltransferase
MFEKIWIQPAAGDSGGALGAALAFFYEQEGTLRPKTQAKDSMQHSQLGTSYTSEQIEETLIHCGAVYIKEDKTRIIERVASDLSLGKSIGWFQGRSEYGPRALGNRSILANASLDETQKRLNLQIKYRESFRPFAPVVLLSEALELFENATESDYMLFTFKLKEKYRLNIIENNNAIGMEKLYVHRSNIPAVTHVDYSARVQTIADDRTDDIALLLKKYKELTGTSVIVNTSFNVRGEPIVNSPSDAFNCFMATELDVLVIESFYLVKALQTANRVDYRQYVESD